MDPIWIFITLKLFNLHDNDVLILNSQAIEQNDTLNQTFVQKVIHKLAPLGVMLCRVVYYILELVIHDPTFKKTFLKAVLSLIFINILQNINKNCQNYPEMTVLWDVWCINYQNTLCWRLRIKGKIRKGEIVYSNYSYLLQHRRPVNHITRYLLSISTV